MAGTASAAPVATNDGAYQALDQVFPEPLAGCKTGAPPCDPNAQGNLPATSFIGIEEFIDAIAYMNSKQEWQRYMEVYALDGSLEGHDETMAQHNNLPLEFDPSPAYQSAGLPTSDLNRRKSDLIAIRVTDESVPDAGKKRYALSLSIHGIERAGAEGGARAMEDLVTAATKGRSNEPIVGEAVKRGAPSYAEVLRNSIIYFTFPNPDGWRRGSVSSGPEGGVFFQRYNGNGVDPNRDWPDIGFSFRPYSAVSEPETAAWISFYNDVKRKTGDRFAAGDDLHGQPFADALSYTLLPHGSHRFAKNQRIQAAAKRINRGTYDAIQWSPIVQENDQPQGGGAPCSPDVLGTACAKIYAQTWGSVYDTINYTTTGALGDWFDSTVGLNADGIDNEMSFSHLDKNIVFDPHTEQLHVDGNRALIFARVAELIDPSHDEVFDARGRKGYVPGTRLQREERRNLPEAPPGTRPGDTQEGVVPSPGEATFPITVESGDGIYNGGMRVEATANNVAGVGTGTATLQVQCKGCDRHPGTDPEEDEWITVAEDYNQSPAYAQAGIVATVNDPQPTNQNVEWRAVVSGIGVAPTAATRFVVTFTSGPASSDGDTGGGPAPVERAYNVANTDFFEDLNDFMPGRAEDLDEIDPRAVIAGRQSLNRFDTIALADDPLPGYTGPFGRRPPTGPPTATQTFEGSTSVPGNGEKSPGTFEERTFEIGPDDSNSEATVTIEWEVPANDFDLNVYLEEPDGTRTLVGRDAGSIPENSETVVLPEPAPGKYVVQVENFLAPDPRWTGKVEFKPLEASGGGTGAYTEDEKNRWFAALREWVRDGGNLVLTDGALRAIGDVSPIPSASVNRQTVYAGQSAFAKADDEDAATTGDPLARGVVQQGARFNSGMRRQMYEPTPLGYAIQDEGGDDAARARQYDIDRERWEKAGGRTVATSADAGARDAQAVYTRVTIGELPMGRGQIRIAGALLPKPTQQYDHQFGLEPYAVTYTGYVMARNLLDAPSRAPGVVSARGNRFKILTKRVRVRTDRKGRQIARIKVRCKARRGCFGKLNLKVRKTKRPGKRDQAEAAGRRKRVRMVTIGRKKRFAIRKAAKARKRVLRVKLTLEGRRLSSRKERLRTRGSATVRFGKKGNGGRGVARRRIVLRRAKGQRPLPPDIRRSDAAGAELGAAAGG